MTILKISTEGQITLEKDLLAYLGVNAGDSIHITKEADNSLKITPPPKRSIMELAGCLKPYTDVYLTLEEISEAIADSYAARGRKP